MVCLEQSKSPEAPRSQIDLTRCDASAESFAVSECPSYMFLKAVGILSGGFPGFHQMIRMELGMFGQLFGLLSGFEMRPLLLSCCRNGASGQ